MLNFNADDWLLTLNAAAPIIYLCLSLIIFARLTYALETTARKLPVGSLTAAPKLEKTDEDPKQTYLLALKGTINCDKGVPSRQEVIAINQKRLDSFKHELRVWAKENSLPGKQPPLQIISEMPALNMLVVHCSAETKEKLEKLEAIADITINRGGLGPI